MSPWGFGNQRIENCILEQKLMRAHSVPSGQACPMSPAEGTGRKLPPPAIVQKLEQLICGVGLQAGIHYIPSEKNSHTAMVTVPSDSPQCQWIPGQR